MAQPAVSDCNGKLYNKDSIIEFLLPSEEGDKKDKEVIVQGAVKSLKDVVAVRFDVDRESKAPRGPTERVERWICPITNKTLGFGTKAVYLVPCGHAFAAVAVREVAEGTEEQRCLQVY